MDGAGFAPRPRKHRTSVIGLSMATGRSLEQRMEALGVLESELEETFARSGGPGGQNVNKVSTAVTLRHLPSGLCVTVQDSRSQAINRKLARETAAGGDRSASAGAQRAADLSRREKIRRQRSPRPRALKKRILEAKAPEVKTEEIKDERRRLIL